MFGFQRDVGANFTILEETTYSQIQVLLSRRSENWANLFNLYLVESCFTVQKQQKVMQLAVSFSTEKLLSELQSQFFQILSVCAMMCTKGRPHHSLVMKLFHTVICAHTLFSFYDRYVTQCHTPDRAAMCFPCLNEEHLHWCKSCFICVLIKVTQ